MRKPICIEIKRRGDQLSTKWCLQIARDLYSLGKPLKKTYSEMIIQSRLVSTMFVVATVCTRIPEGKTYQWPNHWTPRFPPCACDTGRISCHVAKAKTIGVFAPSNDVTPWRTSNERPPTAEISEEHIFAERHETTQCAHLSFIHSSPC